MKLIIAVGSALLLIACSSSAPLPVSPIAEPVPEQSPENDPSLPPPLKCEPFETANMDSKVNCPKALVYEKACRQGDMEACWHVGGFYLEDDNVEFDKELGAKWLDYSCKGGFEYACAWLEDINED